MATSHWRGRSRKRSLAARKGWKRRRLRLAARSRAARKGWRTKRAGVEARTVALKRATRSAAARRGWATRRARHLPPQSTRGLDTFTTKGLRHLILPLHESRCGGKFMREAFVAMDNGDANRLEHWKGQGVTDTAGTSGSSKRTLTSFMKWTLAVTRTNFITRSSRNEYHPRLGQDYHQP